MKKLVLVLTIYIMTFALVGCAGVNKEDVKNPTKVDNYLAAAVGGDDENIEKTLIYPQDASFTKDGITVTARQAVADKHTMYVLLSVTATPDMEFNYNDKFDMHTASINGDGGSNGYEWTTTSKDNKSLFVVVGIDSEEGIDQGTANIALWDFKKTGLEDSDDTPYGVKTYKGTWNVSFDFEVPDITERYTSDTVVETSGLDLAFNYIDISPFGVYVSCKLADSSINPGDDWEEETAEIDVILKDGTEVGITRNLCSADWGGPREDFKYYRSARLIAAIDPAEVAYIVFDGQEVELK